MNKLLTDLFDKTILIVDDAPEDIDLLAALLVNFKRKLATNGEKALEIVMSDNPPDIILLDIMMPGMSGIEVAKRIKDSVKTKNIPIIFTTAKKDEESILTGFEIGAIDYVTKPFNEHELLARITTHLELKHKTELLERSNIVLEEKIRERTKDLVTVNRKLMDFSNTKNQFLKLISHEIRTPLNGICGFSSILHDQLKDTKYFAYTDNLMKSVKRLENFSYVALKITELQSYKKELPKNKVSVKYLVEKSLNNLSKQISEKMINVVIDIDESYPELFLNEEMFELCLINVFDNAIKHSPQNGKIEVSMLVNGIDISINISDEGPGLSKFAEDHLFDIFMSDDMNPEQALGTGLYLSNMIMKAHGGRIILEKNTPEGVVAKLKIG